MPKAFIPARAGAQSTAIAAALQTAGWQVEGSSRHDTDDPHSRAKGADLLVLTVPQDHRPGAMVAFVDGWVTAATQGDIGRVILNLGGTPGPDEAHPFFAEMHAMRARVTESGLPHVVLQPTVYLDNLAAPWAAEGLANGSIASPAKADAPLSWISHRTLAAWVAAVADGQADGRILPIGGPAALTGPEMAQEIGTVMGRDMTYAQIPLDAFADGMDAALGPPAGKRLAAIYAWLERDPGFMHVDPAEAARFGVPLESAADFAKRVLD
ncbi:MAG: hypothetical protein AAF919_19090 [Pseudomonadota bacterium]